MTEIILNFSLSINPDIKSLFLYISTIDGYQWIIYRIRSAAVRVVFTHCRTNDGISPGPLGLKRAPKSRIHKTFTISQTVFDFCRTMQLFEICTVICPTIYYFLMFVIKREYPFLSHWKKRNHSNLKIRQKNNEKSVT